MSKSKRGSGADQYYNAHLFGQAGKYYNQPAAQRERAINMMLERNIAELAMNRFKWDNLPDSIDQRFLEMCLLFHGLAVYYHDDDYDKDLVVRGTGTGFVNMLDHPVSYTVIGPGSQIPNRENLSANFHHKLLPAYIPAAHMDLKPEEKRKKAVPIWPNYMRFPEIDVIRIYASRLASIDRTIEINAKNARRNKILKTSPNKQLSFVNIGRQIDEGVEVIQVSENLDMEAIDVLDLGITPDSYEKLHILRAREWNECMGLLGIDNANQDKKERLVAAEVGANDAQTDSMRYVSLNARRQACEQINDVFGTNISVDFNVEVEAQARALETATESKTALPSSEEK